jgi:hypothetical protein
MQLNVEKKIERGEEKQQCTLLDLKHKEGATNIRQEDKY